MKKNALKGNYASFLRHREGVVIRPWSVHLPSPALPALHKHKTPGERWEIYPRALAASRENVNVTLQFVNFEILACLRSVSRESSGRRPRTEHVASNRLRAGMRRSLREKLDGERRRTRDSQFDSAHLTRRCKWRSNHPALSEIYSRFGGRLAGWLRGGGQWPVLIGDHHERRRAIRSPTQHFLKAPNERSSENKMCRQVGENRLRAVSHSMAI